MSKLSELLNPAPASASAPIETQDTAEDHASAHYSSNPTSPLDALALAASGRVTTDLSPTLQSTPSFTSPNDYHRKDSSASSRPGSSHYILPNPQELSDSSRMPQHPFPPPPEHLSSLKAQDREDGASRELPPLRNLNGDSIMSNVEGLGVGVTVKPEEDLSEHLPGIQEIQRLDPGHGEYHTSAMPQPDYQCTSLAQPPYTHEAGLVNGQAEGHTGWTIGGQGADSQEHASHSALATPIDPNASFDETNTSKVNAELKREDSTRASSVTPSVSNLGVPRPPQSKKRAAPKAEKKVEKKGTASAIKKTSANKKRKLDDESIGGTPISQRSGTPTSSRASKTPAPRNQKRSSVTPMHSSPAPGAKGGDDDADMDDDSELFCICRKPDDHTWMIACDGGCEDWFHGRCVNMNERDGNLIDKYICTTDNVFFFAQDQQLTCAARSQLQRKGCRSNNLETNVSSGYLPRTSPSYGSQSVEILLRRAWRTVYAQVGIGRRG